MCSKLLKGAYSTVFELVLSQAIKICDRLFTLLAKKYYSFDVFNQLQLVCMNNTTVTFDDSRIVRGCRDVVTQKYANLPGIRSYHDFWVSAEMVRDECYTGILKPSPMKLEKGYMPVNVALPTVSDTYLSSGKAQALADTKLTHLKQMCTN